MQVHISWPSGRHGFKDIDPSDVDIKALFSRLAKEHQAEIDAEEVDSAVGVTVRAATRAKAQQIISVLRDQLLYRPGEEKVWQTNLLVEPPKHGGACLTVALHPKEGTTGRRATATTTAVATQDLVSVDLIDHGATKAKYKEDFIQSLDHRMGILRYVPTGMHMRVQFGTLVLNEWKRDKTEYNLAELTSLAHRSGMRGTSRMLNS
jgi:hypothetical protein